MGTYSVSGESLIRVGTEGRDLFATFSNYKDEPTIHIRYFVTEHRFPSKAGVTLRPQEFDAVLDAAAELKREVKKLNKAKRLGNSSQKKKAKTSTATSDE